MVTAYLFDRRQGKSVDDWAESIHRLNKNQILWLDLMDASDDETAEILDALGLGDPGDLKLGDPERKPGIEEHEGHLRVTAVAVSDAEHDAARERIVVDCFVGSNWLLTAHSAEIAVLDDFRAAAEGKGKFGLLDAPSFLSTLLEWVMASYLRAFDEIEETLDEFDVKALANPNHDPEEQIKILSDAIKRIPRRKGATPQLVAETLFAIYMATTLEWLIREDEPGSWLVNNMRARLKLGMEGMA